MKTRLLVKQEDRKTLHTRWNESFRGRMAEVLEEHGAEAPMFDNSLPEGETFVLPRTIAHVAVQLESEEEATLASTGSFQEYQESVRKSAGLEPGVAIKPRIVSTVEA